MVGKIVKGASIGPQPSRAIHDALICRHPDSSTNAYSTGRLVLCCAYTSLKRKMQARKKILVDLVNLYGFVMYVHTSSQARQNTTTQLSLFTQDQSGVINSIFTLQIHFIFSYCRQLLTNASLRTHVVTHCNSI